MRHGALALYYDLKALNRNTRNMHGEINDSDLKASLLPSSYNCMALNRLKAICDPRPFYTGTYKIPPWNRADNRTEAEAIASYEYSCTALLVVIRGAL